MRVFVQSSRVHAGCQPNPSANGSLQPPDDGDFSTCFSSGSILWCAMPVASLEGAAARPVAAVRRAGECASACLLCCCAGTLALSISTGVGSRTAQTVYGALAVSLRFARFRCLMIQHHASPCWRVLLVLARCCILRACAQLGLGCFQLCHAACCDMSTFLHRCSVMCSPVLLVNWSICCDLPGHKLPATNRSPRACIRRFADCMRLSHVASEPADHPLATLNPATVRWRR